MIGPKLVTGGSIGNAVGKSKKGNEQITVKQTCKSSCKWNYAIQL